MKTRKGYISIIALLVMSVSVVMSLYLISIAKLEYLILCSSNNNTQSYYQSEGKIYMSLYDERYYKEQLYPLLVEYFTKPLFFKSRDIIIDNSDLDYGDSINRVKVNIVENKGIKQLNLISESDCNGIKTMVTSSISLFNELLEMGNPVLSLNLIEDKNKEDFKTLFKKITKDISKNDCNKLNNIYRAELINYNEIILHKKDLNILQLSSYRSGMTNPYMERFDDKQVFIIIKSTNDHPVNFSIGESSNLDENIEISGVIYVEGNIIISSNFKFNGIIIVKDGEIIIESKEKPYISGMVILDSIVNYDNLIEKTDVIYDRYNIYKYGIYLTGFLEPKIDLIKSN